jgi:ribonuclease BN (tRNA processing enzyme)
VGPLRFRVARVAHPVETYAVRVSDGRSSLVYSADTGPCQALVELARDADLLLAEAAFREGEDNPPDLHLTGRQAGEAAAAAGVRRLVLTHVPPWYDPRTAVEEARPVFDGDIELARSGARFDL